MGFGLGFPQAPTLVSRATERGATSFEADETVPEETQFNTGDPAQGLPNEGTLRVHAGENSSVK